MGGWGGAGGGGAGGGGGGSGGFFPKETYDPNFSRNTQLYQNVRLCEKIRSPHEKKFLRLPPRDVLKKYCFFEKIAKIRLF